MRFLKKGGNMKRNTVGVSLCLVLLLAAGTLLGACGSAGPSAGTDGASAEGVTEGGAPEEGTQEGADAGTPAETDASSEADPDDEPFALDADDIMVPAPSEELPAGVEYQFLGTFDTGIIGNATVTGNLYYDGTYDVVAGVWTYSSGMSWGTWDYDAENGVFLLDDEDNDLHFTVARGEDDTFSFAVKDMHGEDCVLTAVLDQEKPISTLHADPDPEASVVVKEPKAPYVQPAQTDRYSAMSDEDWETLWREDGYEIAPGQEMLRDYGTKEPDALFMQTLPKEWFAPAPEDARGTVERVTYETYGYSWYEEQGIPESEWEPVEKDCYVYLPASYDPDEKYNVYYLMHGATGNETNWFSMNCDGTSAENGAGDFVILIDNLIASGRIEPTIFVAVTSNTDVSEKPLKMKYTYTAGHEINSLPTELERDLIPAVEGRYASWLSGEGLEAERESRTHRAFGGLSGGAFQTWVCLPENIDVMAYYCPMSNGSDGGNDPQEMIDSQYARLTEEMDGGKYPVGYLFAHCGRKDHCFEYETDTVNRLVDKDGGNALRYGENFYYYTPENGTHTAKYFILAVYNSMQVFFR